jgi:phosphate/sulfate permease
MSAPALIWLALAFISLLGAAHLHGQPKKGNHSLWGSIIGIGIAAGLLYWGGFFASVPA